jgi:hypothetical protein
MAFYNPKEGKMNKLIAALFADAFSVSAFAQNSPPALPTGEHAKSSVKQDARHTKADVKYDEKVAKAKARKAKQNAKAKTKSALAKTIAKITETKAAVKNVVNK